MRPCSPTIDRLLIGLRVRAVSGLRELGARYRRRSDTAAAERAYRRALRLAERGFPPDALETARVCNDLAVLLKYTGNFDEAAELYDRSLEVTAARLGNDHPEVATLLHNLGGVAHAAGRPADGEAPAREALHIRRHALGPDHPDTAADAAALAGILIALNRDDEATTLLTRRSRRSTAGRFSPARWPRLQDDGAKHKECRAVPVMRARARSGAGELLPAASSPARSQRAPSFGSCDHQYLSESATARRRH